MSRILVILGHPRSDSFCAGLADAYGAGARAAGHEVRRIDVGALAIDPVLRTGAGRHEVEEPDLITAREAIVWAEHLVFVWPLWLGAMPAILKGFLERTLVAGFAMEVIEGPPFYRPLLGGRTARVIVTMHMPVILYRLMAGSRATRILRKQILNFVGIRPVRETIFGLVPGSSETTRAGWLAKVRALGVAGA